MVKKDHCQEKESGEEEDEDFFAKADHTVLDEILGENLAAAEEELAVTAMQQKSSEQ